jgi:hypothetical protein
VLFNVKIQAECERYWVCSTNRQKARAYLVIDEERWFYDVDTLSYFLSMTPQTEDRFDSSEDKKFEAEFSTCGEHLKIS